MKRQGTNINILYHNGSDYVPFAYAKSCDYQIKRDMQEVASPTTGQGKEYRPKRYSWQMDISCLLSDDNQAVWDAFTGMTQLSVQWQDNTPTTDDDTSTHEILTGTAYITQLKATAQIHEMATMQISLQGTGTLTRTAS